MCTYVDNYMSEQRQGPTQMYICNGCEGLKTHQGSHDSHHRCKDGAWDGPRKTAHGAFVTTPNECSYMKTIIS